MKILKQNSEIGVKWKSQNEALKKIIYTSLEPICCKHSQISSATILTLWVKEDLVCKSESCVGRVVCALICED